MKINKLTIENYKCFKEFNIEFAPKTTVLIGKNGTGKTSLIHAMHKALSFVFGNSTHKNVQTIAAANSDLKVASIAPREYWKKDKTAASYVSISANAVFHGQELEWTMYKDRRLNTTKYDDAYRKLAKEYEASDTLPLLAYFSDSHPHLEASVTKFATSQIDSVDGPLRNFGYYQWNNENSCFKIWEKRFIKSSKDSAMHEKSIHEDLQEKGDQIKEIFETLGFEYHMFKPTIPTEISVDKISEVKAHAEKSPLFNKILENALLNAEIQFVSDLLMEFSKTTITHEEDMYEIAFVETTNYENNNEILFDFSSNKVSKTTFLDLPAGYRRLFSIVLDIAYRHLMLNCLHKTERMFSLTKENIQGIVIIDEIDLHLHPSLQQEVLLRLRKVFPNVQFIVTTHSPLAITNLPTHDKQSVIYKLELGEKAPVAVHPIYGIDYNTGLYDVMETPPSNIRIDDWKESIRRALLFEDDELVEKYKKKLEDEIGQEAVEEYINSIKA